MEQRAELLRATAQLLDVVCGGRTEQSPPEQLQQSSSWTSLTKVAVRIKRGVKERTPRIRLCGRSRLGHGRGVSTSALCLGLRRSTRKSAASRGARTRKVFARKDSILAARSRGLGMGGWGGCPHSARCSRRHWRPESKVSRDAGTDAVWPTARGPCGTRTGGRTTAFSSVNAVGRCSTGSRWERQMLWRRGCCSRGLTRRYGGHREREKNSEWNKAESEGLGWYTPSGPVVPGPPQVLRWPHQALPCPSDQAEKELEVGVGACYKACP